MSERPKWYTDGFTSIQCKKKCIPDGFYLNTNKRIWYTNGTKDCIRPEGNYQDDFYPGRSTGVGYSTLGKHWYNNGQLLGNFFEGLLPDGWILGSIGNTTSGYITVNDGVNNISIKPGQDIPDGFVKGRACSTNDRYKEAASKRRTCIYNNGINLISLLLTDDVPEGYVKGKLTKEIKKKYRDDYYRSIGYIPLKDLKHKYGINWYVYLDNIDKIVLSEPYVYINEKEIPRIELYVSVNHSKGTSVFEQEVELYIRSICKCEVQTHVKSILKDDKDRYYELDMYIPDKNIAIECNGIYWHSLEVIERKDYHELKSKLCQDRGIRLIHIYQSEWLNSKDKIKLLLNIAFGNVVTKIYARKCEVREISNKEAEVFSNKTHLLGHRNASITYGLFYNDELVLLMSFLKTNNAKRNGAEWEIIRGCPGSNNIVIGGVGKLFSYFIKHNNPKSIFSYCDFNKFNGKSYEDIGMKFIGYTGPDKYWIINGLLVQRSPSRYNELKSIASGVLYGAGSKKYIWINNTT